MTKEMQYCSTIGFFDGVHRGHQFLIDGVCQQARSHGMQSMVITFDTHPRQVVQSSYVPQLITTADEKLRLLHATGADRIEMLHFDREMAAMSAHDFMQQVLHDKLGVRRLVTGYDNRFGHNRSEGFDDYVLYGKDMGIDVVAHTPLDVDGMRVSSSVVRRLIAAGDVAEAAVLMGHRFCIEGTVVHGYGEGRKLGFPTANIAPVMAEQLLPATGVYAVSVSIEGGEPMKAMMNVGCNPTFQRKQITLEAHIANFHGDIYGQREGVEFYRHIREERTFNSVDELRQQIQKDMLAL